MRIRGFTLIEMVVAITISGILVAGIALIISRPVEAYNEQSRRNELIDTSSRIGRLLGNDLAAALPNSVRIGNFASTSVVQMLEVTDVLYYQEEPPTPTAAQADIGLNIAGDTRFQAYGSYHAGSLLVVRDTTGAAYDNTGVIAQVSSPTSSQSFGAFTVEFSPAFAFANGASPTNRMFAVRAPITYVCNRATGQVTRFAGHARNPVMPIDESAAQLNSAGTQSSVVATGITACAVQCSATNGNRCLQTLTFSATVSRGAAPDAAQVRVNRNYRVENGT